MMKLRFLFLLPALSLSLVPILATCTENTSGDVKPDVGAPPAATTAPGAGSSAAGAERPSPGAQAAPFTQCRGAFGNCTKASCTPTPPPGVKDAGADDLWCSCEAQYGWSAGQGACTEVPDAGLSPGQKVASRYAPVNGMVVCTNYDNMPWAWCLDKPCEVNAPDVGADAGAPSATCKCTRTTSSEDWIIVGKSYNDSTCRSNMFVSSATVKDILSITGFLQGSKDLPALPITIVGVGTRKQ
jgi:hypothetical protein